MGFPYSFITTKIPIILRLRHRSVDYLRGYALEGLTKWYPSVSLWLRTSGGVSEWTLAVASDALASCNLSEPAHWF